jgi:hypothetical protein
MNKSLWLSTHVWLIKMRNKVMRRFAIRYVTLKLENSSIPLAVCFQNFVSLRLKVSSKIDWETKQRQNENSSLPRSWEHKIGFSFFFRAKPTTRSGFFFLNDSVSLSFSIARANKARKIDDPVSHCYDPWVETLEWMELLKWLHRFVILP